MSDRNIKLSFTQKATDWIVDNGYDEVYGARPLKRLLKKELENKLIIADIYELGEENLKYGMYIFVELFWDKIKRDRNKNKAIYLDEIWRLIGVTSNKEVASFIYKIFKTIRILY